MWLQSECADGLLSELICQIFMTYDSVADLISSIIHIDLVLMTYEHLLMTNYQKPVNVDEQVPN